MYDTNLFNYLWPSDHWSGWQHWLLATPSLCPRIVACKCYTTKPILKSMLEYNKSCLDGSNLFCLRSQWLPEMISLGKLRCRMALLRSMIVGHSKPLHSSKRVYSLVLSDTRVRSDLTHVMITELSHEDSLMREWCIVCQSLSEQSCSRLNFQESHFQMSEAKPMTSCRKTCMVLACLWMMQLTTTYQLPRKHHGADVWWAVHLWMRQSWCNLSMHTCQYLSCWSVFKTCVNADMMLMIYPDPLKLITVRKK